MHIYLDAVWTLNVLLDYMLLLLTKTLAHDRTHAMRTIIGACIASLIVPIAIYFPNSFFTTVFGKLLFSLLIILSAFKFVSAKRTCKQLLLFYFLTFAVGGSLMGMHFLMNQPFAMHAGGIMTMNSGYGDPVSWLFILIGFPIVWLFSKRRMDQHAAEKIRYDQMYLVQIQIRGTCFSTSGYIDSGNQLICPLTRLPVVIGDEALMRNWFDTETWQQLKTASDQMDPSRIPEIWQQYVQMVPYQGVDGKGRFMLTLRPDFMKIHYDNKVLHVDKVLIGMQFGRMTDDKSYQCLLHPKLIQQGLSYSA